jgi:hypothetical protein
MKTLSVEQLKEIWRIHSWDGTPFGDQMEGLRSIHDALPEVPTEADMSQIFHVMYAEESNGRPITFDIVQRAFQAIVAKFGGKE